MSPKEKAKAKPSARLARAKQQRGEIVAERMKQIAKGKRQGSRGRGYSREDLEALRDGRA